MYHRVHMVMWLIKPSFMVRSPYQYSRIETVQCTAGRPAFALILSVFLLLANSASHAAGAPHWVGSWMAAPSAIAPAEPRSGEAQLQDQTVRQIVHLSIGGLAVRLRFSNTFGSTPLTLGSVHVATRKSGNEVDPGSIQPVTFAGVASVDIPPGKSIVSDPVDLGVTPSSDLAVSFFVPGKVTAPAIHYTALQTSYIAPGDQTAAQSLSKSHDTTLWLILTAVDVATRNAPGAIVAIGSSTTDGSHSTPNQNRRWTDDLFARLFASLGPETPSVLNAGIAGTHVLTDGRGSWGPVFGQSAVSRFSRDVLSQDGVKTVIIFEGGNDIREFGSDAASAQQLISGFGLLARMAHEHGLKVIVATITAFEHSNKNEPEDGSWERTQVAVNQWVRTTRDIDGFVDFDAAIRDPNHHARILTMYDSGDHLHPNDAGYKAMADSIDLSLFTTSNGTVPQ